MKGKLVLKFDILISEEELKELIESHMKLCALESGGVDNWNWYGESLRDFLKENEAEDFSELVEEEIKKYEVVI